MDSVFRRSRRRRDAGENMFAARLLRILAARRITD